MQKLNLPNTVLGDFIRCWRLVWYFCSLAACLLAAATGHPERLLCVFRLELTCPRPLHPGVGHFRIVSCIARTIPRQQNPVSNIEYNNCVIKVLCVCRCDTINKINETSG